MVISTTGADCCELDSNCYAVYGFEYKPGFVEDNGVCVFFSRLQNPRCYQTIGWWGPFSLALYITRINDNETAWTMNTGRATADEGENTGPSQFPKNKWYVYQLRASSSQCQLGVSLISSINLST